MSDYSARGIRRVCWCASAPPLCVGAQLRCFPCSWSSSNIHTPSRFFFWLHAKENVSRTRTEKEGQKRKQNKGSCESTAVHSLRADLVVEKILIDGTIKRVALLVTKPHKWRPTLPACCSSVECRGNLLIAELNKPQVDSIEN